MKKDYILFHLTEAREQLDNIIKGMEGDATYRFSCYQADMEHLYQHLNIAWNARTVRTKRLLARRGSDFIRWRQFPEDLRISLKQEAEG